MEEKIVKEDARDELCDAVKKVREDFLVIRSHGYGTVKRYVTKHYLLGLYLLSKDMQANTSC